MASLLLGSSGLCLPVPRATGAVYGHDFRNRPTCLPIQQIFSGFRDWRPSEAHELGSGWTSMDQSIAPAAMACSGNGSYNLHGRWNADGSRITGRMRSVTLSTGCINYRGVSCSSLQTPDAALAQHDTLLPPEGYIQMP